MQAEFVEGVGRQEFASSGSVPVPPLTRCDPVREFAEPIHPRTRLFAKEIDEPNRDAVRTDQETDGLSVSPIVPPTRSRAQSESTGRCTLRDARTRGSCSFSRRNVLSSSSAGRSVTRSFSRNTGSGITSVSGRYPIILRGRKHVEFASAHALRVAHRSSI